MPMREIQDFPDTGNYGANGSLEAEQVWSLSLLNHLMAFLVSSTDILQRLHNNSRTPLEEKCETLIVKLSNLDGLVDVKSRLYID